ncbi:hypothetical protein [Nocardioides zeae]
MRVLAYGDRAVLVELEATDQVVAWADAFAAAWPDAPVELVPAATTVLVALSGDGPHDLVWLRAAVAAVDPAPGRRAAVPPDPSSRCP